MRSILFLALSLLSVSCEVATLKWGYFHNPEKVLLSAYEAIETGNVGMWYEASAGFPYCKYGSRDGLHFLKRNLKDSQFTGVKYVSAKSNGVKGKGDIIFSPHYSKSYQTSLVGTDAREKALVKLRCHFELPEKVALRDPYNTEEYTRAYCVIESIKIHGAKFTGNEVCDRLE